MRFALAFVLLGCTVPHEGLQQVVRVDGGVDGGVDVGADACTAAEVCNGRDDDCDGSTDEGTDEVCEGNDTPPCSPGRRRCVGGFLEAACSGFIPPGGPLDTCLVLGDEDCDGRIDEDCDCPVDGSVPCGSDVGVCMPGVAMCVGGAPGTCNGGTRPGTETCDGRDEDCDGMTDEGVLLPFYRDMDGDGYGAGEPMLACSAPANHVGRNGDCDDMNAARTPMRAEMCDAVDNDCDTRVDEEATGVLTFYRDGDGDGIGAGPPMTGCVRPSGTSMSNTDCNDEDATIFPGATEACDGRDNDCGGDIDEDNCPGCTRRVRVSDGHTYQFCSTTLAWSAARRSCMDSGYDLVTIESEAEHDFLRGAAAPDGGQWWIGLNDIATEGTYIWAATGMPGAYVTPINGGTASQDCFVLRDDTPDRRWSDRDCASTGIFVCEVAP